VPGRRPARLGQHFLGSAHLAERLVADAGIESSDRVVDLGAGAGVLTAALAACAGSVFAVEIDHGLATGLARRFATAPNVSVFEADVRDIPLPVNPYRVVANPPFGHTAAILHRLLDHPEGGLERADLVVQWQVARHRARVSQGPEVDLVGAIWAPWWEFARGRRIPAALFTPRPAVDAAVLVITRRDPPTVSTGDFAAYAAEVRSRWPSLPGSSGLHSRPSSANMS
jgi:23S rRNA (adenine-N6)-dimethyltransferase